MSFRAASGRSLQRGRRLTGLLSRVRTTMLETTDHAPEAHTSMTQDSNHAAIAARALRRTFKGGIEAVRDIDLTVSSGEVFGFLGSNGAGKTTTVRMLCTLLPPTAGSATVAGLDVVKDAAEVRRRIGVALQEI